MFKKPASKNTSKSSNKGSGIASFFKNLQSKGLITAVIVSVLGAGGLGGLASSIDYNEILGSDWSKVWGGISGQKSTRQIDQNVEEVVVLRSVDGDTVELKDGRKIRFLNMDTPETVKLNTPIMCYGIEAKNASKKLVEGKTVYIVSDKAKTDRYGRELRFIYLNAEDAKAKKIETSVNAILVQGGYAQAKAYSPNTTYKKDFDKWMFEAQNKKLGVWSKCEKPFVI